MGEALPSLGGILACSYPAPSPQRLRLHLPTPAVWLPRSLELAASPTTFLLRPLHPLLTREATWYSAARSASGPWRRAQHLGAGSQSCRSPPRGPQPPSEARGAGAVKPAEQIQPGAPAFLSFLCVRARVGFGRREKGEVAIYQSPPPLPRPLEVRRGGGGGIPRAGARSRGALRFQSRAGSGAPEGTAGTLRAVVPSSHPSARPRCAPATRRPQRSAPRHREGRRPRINSGGSSASSGGAGSAGRVRRPVLPARPQDFAMGWGPRGLRAAGGGQRRRRPHRD